MFNVSHFIIFYRRILSLNKRNEKHAILFDIFEQIYLNLYKIWSVKLAGD